MAEKHPNEEHPLWEMFKLWYPKHFAGSPDPEVHHDLFCAFEAGYKCARYPTIENGQAYNYLTAGEVTKEGDECEYATSEWRTIFRPGQVYDPIKHLRVRRKVPT